MTQGTDPVGQTELLRTEARVIAAVGETVRALATALFLIAGPLLLVVVVRWLTGDLDRLDWYIFTGAIGLVLAGLWCLASGSEIRHGRGPY